MHEKKQYPAVDIAKFIFCLCIVAIHTGLTMCIPDPVGYMINKAVCRVAVPFFFVTSGFLFQKNLCIANQGDELSLRALVIRYCKRLLKILLCFEPINIVLVLIEKMRWGGVELSTFKYILQRIIAYPYGALWYIQASIIAMLLLYPFIRRHRINTAIVIGVVLYIFALLCDNYFFVAERIGIDGLINVYMRFFVSARNGIFTGFLLLALGIKCGELEGKWTRRTISFVLALAFLVYISEILFIAHMGEPRDDGSLYIAHLLLVPALLLYLTGIKIECQKIYIQLRNYSTGIYLLHRIMILLVSVIVGEMADIILYYFVVVGSSALICAIVYKVKKEPFYSLLR